VINGAGLATESDIMSQRDATPHLQIFTASGTIDEEAYILEGTLGDNRSGSPNRRTPEPCLEIVVDTQMSASARSALEPGSDVVFVRANSGIRSSIKTGAGELLHEMPDFLKEVTQPFIVGIEKGDVLRAGRPNPHVSRPGDPAILLLDQSNTGDFRSKPLHDGRTAIRGTIINHEYL